MEPLLDDDKKTLASTPAHSWCFFDIMKRKNNSETLDFISLIEGRQL